MGTVQFGLTSFDEFVALPAPPAGHLELQDGQVVTVPPKTQSHSRLQRTLFTILLPFTEGKGFFNFEFPFRTGESLWQADLAFVREERSDIPDRIIEVLSPGNTASEMNQRIDVCMSNGCHCFWVVDPKLKLISATEGDLTRQYRLPMSIPLLAALEGNIPLAAIFDS